MHSGVDHQSVRGQRRAAASIEPLGVRLEIRGIGELQQLQVALDCQGDAPSVYAAYRFSAKLRTHQALLDQRIGRVTDGLRAKLKGYGDDEPRHQRRACTTVSLAVSSEPPSRRLVAAAVRTQGVRTLRRIACQTNSQLSASLGCCPRKLTAASIWTSRSVRPSRLANSFNEAGTFLLGGSSTRTD